MHCAPIRRPTARFAAGILAIVVLFGCGRAGAPVLSGAPDVPYASVQEVEQLVRSADQPMLLEFCVPSGCSRCDEMREPINALAQRGTGQFQVRRVNLNVERELASQWNVSVCPTYVVFAYATEMGRAAYPTSPDLVASLLTAPKVEAN